MVNIINEISYFFIYVLVILSCPTLCDPMDCSWPGSSIHGIFQARVMEQVATSWACTGPMDRTHVSSSPTLAGRFFTFWTSKEVLFVIYRALLKFFHFYKFYGLFCNNLSCIKYCGKTWNKWKGRSYIVKI